MLAARSLTFDSFAVGSVATTGQFEFGYSFRSSGLFGLQDDTHTQGVDRGLPSDLLLKSILEVDCHLYHIPTDLFSADDSHTAVLLLGKISD